MTTHFSSHAPGLKLIVLYKAVKAVFMLALGAVLLHEQLLGRVQGSAFHAAQWFAQRDWVDGVGQSIAEWIHAEITTQHIEFAIGLIWADAISTSIEGLGLHYRQRWAAWWVVLATSCLIPFELFELGKRFTVTRVVILTINVAIVVYLVWKVLVEQRPHRHAHA